MVQVSRSYPKQLDLTYIYVWNGSGMIESLVGLDCFEAPDKNWTGLDCLDYLAGLGYFETQIRTQQSWIIFRLEFIESIDKSDDKNLVW